MPITVTWENPETKRIIIQRFATPWTVAEMHRVMDENSARLAEVGHSVHIISILPSTLHLPSDFLSILSRVKRLHENEGYHLVVSASDSLSYLWSNVFIRLRPQNLEGKMHLFQHLREACTWLAEKEPDLEFECPKA